jgi:hypothetical protein
LKLFIYIVYIFADRMEVYQRVAGRQLAVQAPSGSKGFWPLLVVKYTGLHISRQVSL